MTRVIYHPRLFYPFTHIQGISLTRLVRSGRSTTTCNAVFCNYIFEAFKAHSQVDVISTDFCKALTVKIIIYCNVSCKQLVSGNHFCRGFVLLSMVGNNLLKFRESLLIYSPFLLVSHKGATSLLYCFQYS